jgi:hypothetical protein
VKFGPVKFGPVKFGPVKFEPKRGLARAQLRDGGIAVVQLGQLVLVMGEKTVTIPWDEVISATWNDKSEALTVVEAGEFGQPQPVHYLRFADDPRRLLEVVRERVTASVVLTRTGEFRGKRAFQVIARRPPTRNGKIIWRVNYEPGLDPHDPELSEAVDHLLWQAKNEFL